MFSFIKFLIQSSLTKRESLSCIIVRLAETVEADFTNLSDRQVAWLQVLKATADYSNSRKLDTWDDEVSEFLVDGPAANSVDDLLNDITELGLSQLYLTFDAHQAYVDIQGVRRKFRKLGKQCPDDVSPLPGW